MIPYLLAIAGGYLIAQSRKQDTFADGGTIENRKDDLMIEQSKEISIFDEKRIGEEIIITLQKKYIKERNELFDKNVTSREITDFIKSRISVEYLIENGVLSPVYSYYSYAFQNTPTLGRPYKYQQAIKLAEQINNINRFDRPIPYYRVLIVPSVIVNSAKFTPELGDYLLYTDNEISEENLKKLGRFEDGGLLKYCWGGKMADGGYMSEDVELPLFYSIAYLQKSPKGKTDWRNWDDEDWDIYAIRHLVYNGIADIEKIGKDEYRVTNLDEDDDYEAVYTGWEIRQLAFDYDLPDSTDLEEEDAIFLSKGGKVENELYVAEFRKGEWTVKDKKNPKGNYTLSSKKENAENVRQFLIDNPSRLKYYRTNEYAKGGKMANGMMADEDEMVYNYVKIKNYPTFQTEEEAKKFIKIGKPFLRKELKEGKIVLVHNGKEYYLAYVKEKMADGAMMERGGKIQTLIMQQNDLDPQGYTLVDYDKEKKEWYWEDYKADTYSSGFKSRKDAFEDLNEYLFKDTEYRYEGKEGTMGQKWPDLPTPTKSHSFREY